MPSEKYDGYGDVFYLLPYDAREFVLRAVFNLPWEQWSRYPSELGRLYGPEVERYADDTHYDRQRGWVTPSSKTKERLIRLAPKYLPKQDKYKLVELIVSPYLRPPKMTNAEFCFDENKSFEDQRKEVWELARSFAKPIQAQMAPLPTNSLRVLNWLYDKDSTAVRAVLGLATAQRNNAINEELLKNVNPAINRIQAIFAKKDQYGFFSEEISFPRGKLKLLFHRPEPTEPINWMKYIIWGIVIYVIIKLFGG